MPSEKNVQKLFLFCAICEAICKEQTHVVCEKNILRLNIKGTNIFDSRSEVKDIYNLYGSSCIILNQGSGFNFVPNHFERICKRDKGTPYNIVRSNSPISLSYNILFHLS